MTCPRGKDNDQSTDQNPTQTSDINDVAFSIATLGIIDAVDSVINDKK